MERFLALYQSSIVGVLEGFDRLLFRGTVLSIGFASGLEKFLVHHRVLLKEFGAFAEGLTGKIKRHAKKLAERLGRPYVFVRSAADSKDELIRQILAEHPVQEGLIAVLACVEPCQSFDVRSNQATHKLELYSRPRQCTHLYFYYLDREFGLLHVRVQTWLPFPIQVCINGREYLARQLAQEGIGFEQCDNSFRRIDDLPRAQQLLDRLQTRSWVGVLNRLARRVMPLLRGRPRLRPYYWTLRQGEYATDILFRDEAALQRIYPQLLEHAWRHFSCRDLLRFLGRRIDARFAGETTTNVAQRPEGVRIKHWVEENSLKMYDKHGCILRIETTINQPYRFRVRRVVLRHGRRVRKWLPLRKGVVDLWRRADLSRAANHRYLEALADARVTAPVHQVLDPVSRPIVRDGRPYRGLRPLSADEARLFAALLNGRFTVHGFRNRDVRQALTGRRTTPTAEARRRLSGQATRWLRLLRAHGLIRKVPCSRRYRLTQKGTAVMTTALTLRQTNVASLVA
jgi:hypothetical protein